MTGEASWHRLEHSAYAADIPLWIELASSASGQIVEVGAGCGRVASALSSAGYQVVAVERDPDLAAPLRAARYPDSLIRVVEVDPFQSSALQPIDASLYLFPLLVLQLVAAELGLDLMMERLREMLPQSATAAVCLSYPFAQENNVILDPSPATELPRSSLVSLKTSQGKLVLERIRVDRSTSSVRIEELAELQADALSRGLGRPIREVRPIPAAEGVQSMQVVVL